MTNNELKAMEFLKQQIWKHSEIDESSKRYRYEHSLRVAEIGRRIAKAEGFEAEALAMGCILHDVGTFDSVENPKDHGRISARIAREFLSTLELPKERIEEICYGIAIHVDDKADFEGERTALNESIGDSDNIDRFDVYRIYDNLLYLNFHELTLEEKLKHVNKYIPKLKGYCEMKFATKTGTAMWLEKLAFQIEFYDRLKVQLQLIRSL
jgi:putative nucleotidyltransferase with HDIG domain